jgi:hypothetical protein
MNKLINPVSGEVKEITIFDLLEKMDPSTHASIMEMAARYPDKEALVLFECLQMDSGHCGSLSVLAMGPSNSWPLSKVEDAGFRLGDVPSRFLYPVAYVDYRKKETQEQ